MKYSTKNYLDKGDFTKAQEVIENLKSEIKSIIAKKEESNNSIKNYNNNLKNNNYNPEKQKIIGGDKLAEILEILKNVPRVAKLRISDPLLIKTAYGLKLLKERSKKTREALKKAKRGEIFVYDDYIDPELTKIKQYVNEIEKNLDEQTSIIEDKESILDDTEIMKSKELNNLIDLILKYYKKQFDNLFENEVMKKEGYFLINNIGNDLLKLFKSNDIWKVFLLLHNLILYEECMQIDLHLNGNKNFNFYLKTSHFFTKNKNLPDRRISSLVYKKKDKPTYYHIVGFHLFRINDNFEFKKDYLENLKEIKIYEKNTLPEIKFENYDKINKTSQIKKIKKYLGEQEKLLNENYFMNPYNITDFVKKINEKIEKINNDNLQEEIGYLELDRENKEKIEKKISTISDQLIKLEINTNEIKELKEELKEIFIDIIKKNKTLEQAIDKNYHKTPLIKSLKEKTETFKKKFSQFKGMIENCKEALDLLNEIYEFILANYEEKKIITPEDFNELEPVKFDSENDVLWNIIKKNVGEENKNVGEGKISYIQNKIRDQVKSYKNNNKIENIEQPNCKDFFNIDFDEQTKGLNYVDFKVDEDDLEIKKLINIQKNIKKHTDDIIDLYQNIDSLGKGPVKDIDDKDIKFSTNLLKQYVDKQILKGEKIKDIRRNFYRKIKRITHNDNDKYYLNKLEELLAEGVELN